MDDLIKRETAIQKVSLWGQYIMFHPRLVSGHLGDGKQLIKFGTIDSRPKYWLVRIDSKTNIESDEFNPDDVADLITDDFEEKQFGNSFRYPEYKNTMGTWWEDCP